MNIYTLPEIGTTQPAQGSDEYISAFESALSRTINQRTKNSAPKIPARPVRRGYLLSLAFTKYPDKSFDLFLIGIRTAINRQELAKRRMPLFLCSYF